MIGPQPQMHWGIVEYWAAASGLQENIWWWTITIIIIVDCFTGTIKNVFPNAKVRLSSQKGIYGLIKNFMIWFAMTTIYPLTMAWGISDVANAFLVFLIGFYGLSIVENFGVMGIKFPAWVVYCLQKLEDIKSAGNGGNDEIKK